MQLDLGQLCRVRNTSTFSLHANAFPNPALIFRPGQRFADMATDLGTTLFAFIKAQILQTRRARDGTFSSSGKHRRGSSAEAAAAMIAANVAADGNTIGGGKEERGKAGTNASPQAWAKLNSLTYTRDQSGEKLPFPVGLVGLLKAISSVLDHCVGTGDLAVRRFVNDDGDVCTKGGFRAFDVIYAKTGKRVESKRLAAKIVFVCARSCGVCNKLEKN